MNRQLVHAVEHLTNRRLVILDEHGWVHRTPRAHPLEGRAVVTTVVAAIAYGRVDCWCLNPPKPHPLPVPQPNPWPRPKNGTN